ncbi:MAG: hypothetical protein ACLPKE_11970 [Streptosporangiaceae bacterium]
MSHIARGPRRLARLAGVGGLALVLTACAGGHPPAPAAAPPTVPGEAAGGPDLSGVQVPDIVMPAVQGRVSLPSSTLTPGAVTTTDANTVCNIPAHARAPAMPAPEQTAVLTAYGYTTAAAQHKYVLDYLVPYDLGGAATQANIWPAAIRGTGFYQKTQTDYILRQLVCRRSISLVAAQEAVETNWYVAWLRYVVAGGHA